MEAFVEFLFQIFGEILLQIAVEVLTELGIHTGRAMAREPPKPWAAAIGFSVAGTAAGVASLWAFPAHFIASPEGRILNLLVAPVVAGAAMAAIGAWRRSRGQPLIRLDGFAYAYLFALAMALVRFGFGR
ncbi:MAG: hypothetical protein JNK11_02765 [Alphaproteobacteria bacterium]|nr:hypothetical protein [Alphaproteobacteria bacterium]